jgi:hypothetical protein
MLSLKRIGSGQQLCQAVSSQNGSKEKVLNRHRQLKTLDTKKNYHSRESRFISRF